MTPAPAAPPPLARPKSEAPRFVPPRLDALENLVAFDVADIDELDLFDTTRHALLTRHDR